MSGDAYESRQRAGVTRLDLQRFVEEIICKLFLHHVVHGVQVLKEFLQHNKSESVSVCNVA